VPISAPRYDGQYCGRSGCVVEKIKHYREVLANRSLPRRERQHALLFLIHFVGDLHQPLHVGDNGDRGGNLTQIQFLDSGTNLHRLWDSDLIRHLGGNDRVWVERVNRTITPETVKTWSRGAVEDWADESLRAAKRAYSGPEGSPATLTSGARLGEDYVRMAKPIVQEQMGRAGVRLANELNAIFH
jgi:nuclease S1